MSTGKTERLFAITNLDPALAEAADATPADTILEGIIRLEDPSQVPPDFRVVSRFHRICTGRFAAGRTWTIRRHPNVISLKASRPLGLHDDGLDAVDRFDTRGWTKAENEALAFRGRGCIVAALDFGLDFAHPDFLNPDGTTRLLAFWNQSAAYDPAHPNRFGYGRQHLPAEINAALRAADPYLALGYGPQRSDTGNGSHGTHTLDIAAGNGRAAGSRPGAASEACLMFVHLSTRRLGTSENLGDSVRLLEALDWVDETARGRPWAVNLSVGSTAGSHDGTSPVEQGMHELLRRGEGKAIIQSAGNYRSADLAVHGHLNDGEYRDLHWIIDPTDTTPNEVDAWYSGKDRFVVALRPPHGADFLRVRLGEVAAIVHGGAVVGRIYHRKNDPNNGDNHVAIFLYANAPPGIWTLRLTGDYVINGRYHAWIERTQPSAQSRFDPGISSSAYTLGTIATSPRVITVGAYDAHAEDFPLAPFSSCGPTRDERRDKPELLAPGVAVLAARSIPRGALRQEGLLIERSGTSMAAPHVTGVAAAMFEAAGRPVSLDVIRECLKRSAWPHLHAKDADCCAWGRLDAAAALRAIVAWVESEPGAATEWIDGAELASADAPIDRPATSRKGDVMSYNLDRAEQILQSTAAGKRDSETWFLQGLLREIDPEAPLATSPAQLFQNLLRPGRVSERIRRILDIVAKPFEQPDRQLLPGDVMLRATPGTGDMGHVMVLVSSDLRPPAALAADGIIAESTTPGRYGMVIEAGAFPHDRSAPYARRWLDGRGRVPPNSLIVRPNRSQDDPYLDFPSGGSAQESAEDPQAFAAPAWLKVERRSRARSTPSARQEAVESDTVADDTFAAPAWLKVERRSRSQPKGDGFESYGEAFTFDPTAAQTDFGPQLRKAWHELLKKAFKMNLDEAARRIAMGLGIATADAAKHVRFFSPAERPPSVTLSDANVSWRAFPTSGGPASSKTYKFFDELQMFGKPDGSGTQLLRAQDEYCEWKAFRDDAGNIKRVVFTSEPPEYYQFLYDPGVASLTKYSRALLVRLYQERCDGKPVALADLEAAGAYDPGNKWNNDCCVHLQHPANTLGAQINIAARAAILRSDPTGNLVTSIKALIACDPPSDQFGVPSRQSDPAIGDNVNKLARENRFLTLANPVGLYMVSLDTSGWTTPDDTDAQTFWKVLKGKGDKDPRKSMIVRAEFAVPESKKYTVSDIKIAGVPIKFGSQIAEQLEMRLGALFGPVDKDPEGRKTGAPTPVPC
jgi:subtilisin family serine protease